MDFKCKESLNYPIELVWTTFRDHLPEISAQQDDIEYVKVEKRVKKKPDAIHVVSLWKSNPSIPGFIKKVITPDLLIWTDTAIWDNEEHICHFTIDTHYKIEDVKCEGTIHFESTSAGKHTRITYSGQLTIEKTPRSSIFMTGFVIKAIEAFAERMIETNFSKVVKSCEERLKSMK